MQDVLGKLIIGLVVISLGACASSESPKESNSSDAISTEDTTDSEFMDENDGVGLSESGDDSESESTNFDLADEQEIESDLDGEFSDASMDSGEDMGITDGSQEADANFESDDFDTETVDSGMAAGGEGLSAADSGKTIDIVNLRYLANEGGGTVAIETSDPATLRTRFNKEQNQLVVEVANARLPAKLKRPFNTKEFNSAVGSIDAYQKPGETTARFVIQLRGDVEPKVRQEGNTILVAPNGDTFSDPMSVADGAANEDESEPSAGDRKILEAEEFKTSMENPTKYYGRPISLQLKDADVRDVLTFLAEESGLNLVVSDAVNGKVTLKLRDIPWDHALLVILKTQKLGYVRQGNILRIAPLEKLKEESIEEAKVLESKKTLEPLMVRVLPVSYADVGELQGYVKEFLSTRGKVIADKRSQALIVTDIVDSLERIGKLVTSLDTPPPQVLIEGKIVEAQDAFGKEIGVNWSLSGGDGISIGDGDLTAEPAIRSSPSSAAIGALGMLGTLTVGTFEGLGNLDASLALAEREEQVKILSSPRIVTINNEVGEISQETEIPFITATLVNGQTTKSVNFKPAKLTLKVTPQITVDGGVMMLVDVAREFFGGVVDQESGARRLNKRAAKTRILVKNGQTAVLGGIYQSEMTNGKQGIPALKDIPLIGALFNASSQQTEKNELLIFLTPRILNYKSAFIKGKESKL